MNVQELLDWVLLLISAATLISGAVQIFAPGLILGLIAGEITPATQQGIASFDLLSGILTFWYMKLAGNQKSLP
jgi:hypothetical protein